MGEKLPQFCFNCRHSFIGFWSDTLKCKQKCKYNPRYAYSWVKVFYLPKKKTT